MKDPVVLFCAAASDEEAHRIAQALVKDALAACVNRIAGVRSTYTWKGELCDECEVLLIIKSRRELVDRIIRQIKDMHSYDVPEVIVLPIIAGSEDYLNWMKESLI